MVVPCFEEGVDDLGLHFLDIFHKSYWGTTPPWEGSDKYEPRTPCAVELAEAGIRFKKSDTDSIHDVDFENGVLSMPLFELYDSTEIYVSSTSWHLSGCTLRLICMWDGTYPL